MQHNNYLEKLVKFLGPNTLRFWFGKENRKTFTYISIKLTDGAKNADLRTTGLGVEKFCPNRSPNLWETRKHLELNHLGLLLVSWKWFSYHLEIMRKKYCKYHFNNFKIIVQSLSRVHLWDPMNARLPCLFAFSYCSWVSLNSYLNRKIWIPTNFGTECCTT